MKSITQQKALDDVKAMLQGAKKVFIVGCGMCPTMVHTGGRDEVLQMSQDLGEDGKTTTGWMVVPILCDFLTPSAIASRQAQVGDADAVLVMSCGLGVQMVSGVVDKPVYPALDTLYVGLERVPRSFSEVCVQCGDCVLDRTGGICPIAGCPKGLLNGPCGGSAGGRCEVDAEKECVWATIYERLERIGQLDKMTGFVSPKNYQAWMRPRKAVTVG